MVMYECIYVCMYVLLGNLTQNISPLMAYFKSQINIVYVIEELSHLTFSFTLNDIGIC